MFIFEHLARVPFYNCSVNIMNKANYMKVGRTNDINICLLFKYRMCPYYFEYGEQDAYCWHV